MTLAHDFFDQPGLEIPFSGGGFDRADQRRQDTAWLAAQRADSASRFLAFVNLDPVLAAAAPMQPLWFAAADLPAAAVAEAVLLGLDAGAARFAARIPADAGWAPPDGAAAFDLRQVMRRLDLTRLAPLGQARALLAWHARRPYCSACGGPTRMARAGYMRQCLHDHCGAQHFPRTDPVVIMLAVRGDHCLLGRQPAFPAGMYSALAGFMEPGESIEDAVRREVREEAGIGIGQVRYVGSQPWPFPSSLMIGCLAQALDDVIVLDDQELEDARWVAAAEVRQALLENDPQAPLQMPPAISMAHHLVRYWLDNLPTARQRGRAWR
ncbi:MAG: hypothetical protein Tsb0016_15780 [Sphingomonadales bacterium]